MKHLRGYGLILLFFVSGFVLHAQHHHPIGHEPSPHPAAHVPHYRVAVLIGHTLIEGRHVEGSLFIPSWGLDLEYWPSAKWGIGLHNDLELESFILIGPEGEEIERMQPLVITADALYQFKKGWIISLGPGIEIERGENYPLVRLGIEWEIEMGKHFDLAPTIFYDQRLDGYHTWSVALGVGKRF